MAFSDVAIAVKALLDTVSGIGQVHTFKRHTRFWDDFFKRHQKNMQVNDWEITRRSMRQPVRFVQNAAGNEPGYFDIHTVVIQGVMSLRDKDETETQFQDLIDAVMTKLRLNNQLSGASFTPIEFAVPVQEHRTFAGVLVHFTEIVFEAVEDVGG